MFTILFVGYTPVGVSTHKEQLPFMPTMGMKFNWLDIKQHEGNPQQAIPMIVVSIEACRDDEGWLFRVELEMEENDQS